ncbi:MAG: hypothetical protein ABI680_11305 [Chthoniobacteraceae bacterium]
MKTHPPRLPARFKDAMKIITLLALTSLTLTACDSKQEELRKAELENRADKLEEAAKATEKAAEGDAKVVKKQGEAQAEALKNAAEKTRDQK